MYGMSQILAKTCIEPAGFTLLNRRLGMVACACPGRPLIVRQCSFLFDVIDHDQFDIDDLLSDEQLTLNQTYLTFQNEIMLHQANNTFISGGIFIDVNTTQTAENGVWLFRFPPQFPAIPEDCPH